MHTDTSSICPTKRRYLHRSNKGNKTVHLQSTTCCKNSAVCPCFGRYNRNQEAYRREGPELSEAPTRSDWLAKPNA